MLEQTIRGTESGLSEKLPTPSATDYKNQPTSNSWKAKGGINYKLSNPEIQAKWPTPATKSYGHAAEGMVGNLIEKIEQGVITKLEAEQMLNLPKLENHRTWKKKFPTPNAQDHKAGMSNAPGRQQSSLPRTIAIELGTTQKESGGLNPMWVEWLMGWPLGWTDLKPLEMDKSLSVQQQPGES